MATMTAESTFQPDESVLASVSSSSFFALCHQKFLRRAWRTSGYPSCQCRDKSSRQVENRDLMNAIHARNSLLEVRNAMNIDITYLQEHIDLRPYDAKTRWQLHTEPKHRRYARYISFQLLRIPRFRENLDPAFPNNKTPMPCPLSPPFVPCIRIKSLLQILRFLQRTLRRTRIRPFPRHR